MKVYVRRWEIIDDIVKIYRALSSPDRQYILEYLRENPGRLTDIAKVCNISLVEAKRNLQILIDSGLVYLGDDRRYRLSNLGLFIMNLEISLDITLKMWKDFETLLSKIPKDLLPSPIELSGLEIVKDPHLVINYANKMLLFAKEEICAMNIADLIPFLSNIRISIAERRINIRVILNNQNLKALQYHYILDNVKNIRVCDKDGLVVLLNEHSSMIMESDNLWRSLISTTLHSYKFVRNIFDYFWRISTPYTGTQVLSIID